MAIDIEALVVNFLLAQTTITAVVTDRVYTDRPHQPAYPMVLVSRTGGGSIYKNHLDSAELSIQTLGGTHKVASRLASDCITAMAASLVGKHAEGVVTKLKTAVIAYEPEPESTDPQGHSRPRFTVSVVVTAHP